VRLKGRIHSAAQGCLEMTRSGHPTSVSRLLLTIKPGHQPLM
jgi:hypothetical protein